MSELDQQNEDAPSHLPASLPSIPKDDPIHAELNEAEFMELPKSAFTDPRPSATQWTFAAARMVIYVTLGLGAMYFVYGHGGSAVTVTSPPQIIVRGWDNLAPCASFASLDERKGPDFY